ncbi:uracil-DNA glycosylase family protein [Pengzhenrongella sicca]|uniref:uracil-DNA glycosylase family protein n=1 Tax=Pengzhenrongella sicca TaxID=2819238 RepID=UPI001D0C8C22|nr:uracil-DNA glycosylase family protein [Pengzhenrongella sicca]
MSEFDPGYRGRYLPLVRRYPDESVYPADSFRVEWGPIFHRGRLDGAARILVIGQDPAAHEAIARRILVGEAGQRAQGLLARLGITRSYVFINAFLYSVYGQGGGTRHIADPGITRYRNRWIDAIVKGQQIEAIISLGQLADQAYQAWRTTPLGASSTAAYMTVRHPTYPESASGSGAIPKASRTGCFP